jgi:hypothetical protein
MINTQDPHTAVLHELPSTLPVTDRGPQPAEAVQPVTFLQGVSVAEIAAELERVVASPDFRASERNKRVLRYIVQNTLEGNEHNITAYNFATLVYGRPTDFNPLKDPIVRIEMARLRRDLEMYYLKSGRRNPLRFAIPKGRYFLRVTRPSKASDGASQAATQASPFLVSVLRASLNALAGRPEEAAAAWRDLLTANASLVSNLHESVAREIGDEEVTRLVVDGVLRAAGGKN